ncbi:MAG: ComF family protein [Fibrobacter sp.]|mgnify:CR=1 FL=1|nr:ComF family protein [Fibrobacter sp.]
MTIELTGNWETGFALDYHTIRSIPVGIDDYGHTKFETTRTEIGELVYQLKYKNDDGAVMLIVNKIKQAIKGIEIFNYLVPIPPSNKGRQNQPVLLVVDALSKEYKIPVIMDALVKNTNASQIKNVEDTNERLNALQGFMSYNPKYNISDKSILLVDDLYDTGSTLKVATELLYSIAKVKKVCVLTLTKTKGKR